MSVGSWSDGFWAREAASRLVAVGSDRGKSQPQIQRAAYTPFSASAVLARCGFEPSVQAGTLERNVAADETISIRSAASTEDVQRRGMSQSPREVFLAFEASEIESLEALLGWSMACAAANSAFLLDAQGFVVDRAGDWSYELAEATGTHVLLAFERLGKSELSSSSPRSLVVEFEDHWLTAIPVPAGHGETYTLCLVTGVALSPGRIGHIGSAIAEGIGHV